MKPQSIIRLINSNFSVNIKEKNRNANYVIARDLYFDLAYKYLYPKMTFVEIAKAVERDHATMLYAIRKKKKPSYKRILAQYIKLLGNEKPIADVDITDKINRELQKRLDLVEFRYAMLKIKHKEVSKDVRADFLNEIDTLPLKAQESLLERFKIILEMEKKKVYTYKEFRNQNQLN